MLMKFVNDDVEALEEAQSNVIIFKVADPHQLHHKISMIIQLIKTTPEISLICFDAIGEYFWLSDDNYDESMEGFIRSNRNIFEDICQDFKISFIYVRAAFIPKNMGMQEVNYVISLTPSLEALKFEMLVEFSNRRIVHIYMIDLYGLTIC